MAVLDGRLSKKQPQATGLVAKKVRKTGTPSDSVQPEDAPVWAVIKDTDTLLNIVWVMMTCYFFTVGDRENSQVEEGKNVLVASCRTSQSKRATNPLVFPQFEF